MCSSDLDRTISHAISQAYSVATIKERSPEVHLFIDLDPGRVDVNVHPTKAEVRFRDQSYIHEIIRRTLGDALGRGPAPELQLQPDAVVQALPSTLPLPHAYPTTFPSRWQEPSPVPAAPLKPLEPAAGQPLEPIAGRPVEPSTLRPMMALGQFRDTFIIAVDEEGRSEEHTSELQSH